MLQNYFLDFLSLNLLDSISEYKDIISNIIYNFNIIGVFIISFVLLSIFLQDVKWFIHYSSAAAKDLLGKLVVGVATGATVGATNAAVTKLLNNNNNNNNSNSNPNATNNTPVNPATNSNDGNTQNNKK